ncbi:hypothetical protein JAB6_21810 [Janthinobacterium sp. HH104]|nr:hypothetical protein JAB6_21810 [Janthinobacterium sp. HH104]
MLHSIGDFNLKSTLSRQDPHYTISESFCAANLVSEECHELEHMPLILQHIKFLFS